MVIRGQSNRFKLLFLIPTKALHFISLVSVCMRLCASVCDHFCSKCFTKSQTRITVDYIGIKKHLRRKFAQKTETVWSFWNWLKLRPCAHRSKKFELHATVDGTLRSFTSEENKMKMVKLNHNNEKWRYNILPACLTNVVFRCTIIIGCFVLCVCAF